MSLYRAMVVCPEKWRAYVHVELSGLTRSGELPGEGGSKFGQTCQNGSLGETSPLLLEVLLVDRFVSNRATTRRTCLSPGMKKPLANGGESWANTAVSRTEGNSMRLMLTACSPSSGNHRGVFARPTSSVSTRPRIAPSSRSAAKTGWGRPMSHGGVREVALVEVLDASVDDDPQRGVAVSGDRR